MDISNLKSGDNIEGLKCPKCREKHMRVLGTSLKRDKTHEVECPDCMFSQWVDAKNIQLTYESKEEKEEKAEAERLKKEEEKSSRRGRR